MNVDVTFLGIYRDLAERRIGRYELRDGATVGDLLDLLVDRHPGLKPFRGDIRVLCNGLGVGMAQQISHSDEIVLVDPISGG